MTAAPERAARAWVFSDMTAEDRKKYGGGFVWGLGLTSQYPDEGLRLPYHAYLDRPDEVERFIGEPIA